MQIKKKIINYLLNNHQKKLKYEFVKFIFNFFFYGFGFYTDRNGHKCKDYGFWVNISRYKYLTEDFIEMYKDDLEWSEICEHQKLSEEFIEKRHNYVIWRLIFTYQQLSEPFIFCHVNRFPYGWSYVCYYQNVSIQFLLENPNELYMEGLMKNKNIKLTDEIMVALKLRGVA